MIGLRTTSKAQGLFIPKGKILRIVKGGGREIPINVPCVLEEDITLTLSSTFAPIISGGIPNLIKLIAPVIGAAIGKEIPVGFKQFGYQLWQSTDPLSFSATVGFYMDTDAEVDVYNPTMELIQLPLPTEIGTKGGLKAPGPSILSMVSDKEKPTEEEKDQRWFEEMAGRISMNIKDTLSLYIGQLLYLGNIIVKKAQPTFSSETDDHGFSIWSKIQLDISTVETATTNMIKQGMR